MTKLSVDQALLKAKSLVKKGQTEEVPVFSILASLKLKFNRFFSHFVVRKSKCKKEIYFNSNGRTIDAGEIGTVRKCVCATWTYLQIKSGLNFSPRVEFVTVRHSLFYIRPATSFFAPMTAVCGSFQM